MPTRRLMTRGLYNARDLGGLPTPGRKSDPVRRICTQ